MKASERRAALERAKLYLVAPGEFPIDVLSSVIDAGVDLVQLRMKDADAAEIVEIADQFRGVCEGAGVLFVVNDRPDVAFAVGADGVHLGQDDLSPASARDIVGRDVLIGRSTHSREQIDRGREEHASGCADYIAVGPVFETPTAPGKAAVGPELLTYAAGAVDFPWFAIGGIGPANVSGLVDAGARRIAVVRAITEARDPEQASRDLKTSLP